MFFKWMPSNIFLNNSELLYDPFVENLLVYRLAIIAFLTTIVAALFVCVVNMLERVTFLVDKVQ